MSTASISLKATSCVPSVRYLEESYTQQRLYLLYSLWPMNWVASRQVTLVYHYPSDPRCISLLPSCASMSLQEIEDRSLVHVSSRQFGRQCGVPFIRCENRKWHSGCQGIIWQAACVELENRWGESDSSREYSIALIDSKSNSHYSARTFIIIYMSSTSIFVLSNGYLMKTTQFGQFLYPTFSEKEVAITAGKAVTPLYVCGRKMPSGALSKLWSLV